MAAEKKKNVFAGLSAPWAGRLKTLGRLAAGRNMTACLVGGCVRDLLLRRAPLDWDVVVQGAAGVLVREAAEAFKAEVTQHPAFFTYTLSFPDGSSLDVATARQETYPEPAALPVVEPATLAQDFARRDFTANAVAAHLEPSRWGEIEDPFDGRADMKRGLVRVLHEKSFEDDPTRIYRAARYAGRYGWTLEPLTARLLRAAVAARGPARLTPARLRTELERLLEERDPRPALERLWKQGAWTSWNPAWRWSPFLKRALDPKRVEGLDAAGALAFRLMAVCRDRPSEVQADLARLEFPRAVSDAVGRGLRLYAAWRRKDFDFADAARLAPAARAFLSAALGGEKLVERWESSAPLLDGADLQRLGYAPGPVFQKIFESIRAARWRGVIKTRDAEIRHAIDNFPRKQ